MTGAPISLAQQQVATMLRAGLVDPAGIMAVTGEPGLGKTVTVHTVIREQGLTAWVVSPESEDLSARLALLYKAKSLASYVLVIEDAHSLAAPTLAGIFALLARDRGAFPRVVFVARPSFWHLFDDPALTDARNRIQTVAILFPLTAAESEQFLCSRLGTTALRPWARALLREAQGNPRRLWQAVAHRPSAPEHRPRSRRWSAGAMSGSIALLVLALAVALLAISVTDLPLPGSSPRAGAPSAPPRSSAL